LHCASNARAVLFTNQHANRVSDDCAVGRANRGAHCCANAIADGCANSCTFGRAVTRTHGGTHLVANSHAHGSAHRVTYARSVEPSYTSAHGSSHNATNARADERAYVGALGYANSRTHEGTVDGDANKSAHARAVNETTDASPDVTKSNSVPNSDRDDVSCQHEQRWAAVQL